MRTDRLEYLARKILPFVKTERFDMHTWSCGTSACAFGHMCLSPRGKADGLKISPDTFGYREPRFDGVVSIAAACAYFDIDEKTASWLFLGPSYADELGEDFYYGSVDPARVASRIETLLAAEA